MIRRGFAAWLVTLAIAATGLANFTLWARSQLLDDQTFTRTTTSVLDNSAVRDVLASRITDAVMTQVPTEYVDQRPTVEAGIRNVVDTPEFAATFSQAVTTAHHAVFDGGDGGLTVDLVSLEPTIRAEVARIQPGLEQFLPTAQQVGPVQLVSPGDFPDLHTPAKWARRLATGTVVAAIALFAAALLISPNRATTLMAGGIGVVVTSGLTLLAIWGGRRAVLGQIDSPDSKDAVRALSSALTDDLRTRTIIILIIGVVAALAGVGLGRGPADGLVRPFGRRLRRTGRAASRSRRAGPRSRRPPGRRPSPAPRRRRGDTIDVTPDAWDAYAGRRARPRPGPARPDPYGRDPYGRGGDGRGAYGSARAHDPRATRRADPYGRPPRRLPAESTMATPPATGQSRRYAPPRADHARRPGGPAPRSAPRQTSPVPGRAGGSGPGPHGVVDGSASATRRTRSRPRPASRSCRRRSGRAPRARWARIRSCAIASGRGAEAVDAGASRTAKGNGPDRAGRAEPGVAQRRPTSGRLPWLAFLRRARRRRFFDFLLMTGSPRKPGDHSRPIA